MKLFRKSLLALVAVVLIASFTACDTDDHTKRSELFFTTKGSNRVPTTNRNGYFEIAYPLNVRDIRGLSSYDYIKYVDVYDSYLSFLPLLGFRKGDYIEFGLSTTRIGEYSFIIDRNSNEEAYIDVRNTEYTRFMRNLLMELIEEGQTVLYIRGNMRNRDNIGIADFQFDIESLSDLDITVRDQMY